MTRVQLTKPHHQLGSLSLTTPSDMASPNPGGLSHDPRGLYPIARVALHSHPGKPALPGNAVASTSCFCLLDLKQSSCVSSRPHSHVARVLESGRPRGRQARPAGPAVGPRRGWPSVSVPAVSRSQPQQCRRWPRPLAVSSRQVMAEAAHPPTLRHCACSLPCAAVIHLCSHLCNSPTSRSTGVAASRNLQSHVSAVVVTQRRNLARRRSCRWSCH